MQQFAMEYEYFMAILFLRPRKLVLMQKPLQITIPEPCSQNWEEMTPCSDGRFCDHCKTPVVDFTNWNDTQVYNYYQQHQGKYFCGRFLESQLNRPIVPAQPQSRLYRIFVGLGLVLIFGQIPVLHAQVRTHASVKQHQTNANKDNKTFQLKGIVLDKEKEPVINAVIQLYQDNKLVAGTVSDYDGLYNIRPLDAGSYDVVVTMQSYKPIKTQIVISTDQQLNFNMQMNNEYLHQLVQPVLMGIPPRMPYYDPKDKK